MHRIKNAQTKNAQEKMLTNAHKKKTLTRPANVHNEHVMS